MEKLPQWWRRALGGFGIGAVVLAFPWFLLVLMLLVGGRFQLHKGTEVDTLLLVVTYPLGPAITCALLGVLLPLARRSWVAVGLGILTSLPWFALLSIAFSPHGPRPYSVDWPIVLIMALVFGPVCGAGAHDILHDRHKRVLRD